MNQIYHRLVDLLRPWHPDGSTDAGEYVLLDRADLDELTDRERRSLPDAVVLAVASRWGRRRLRRRLRQLGLTPRAVVLLVPGWPATEHVLSVGPQLADGIERHLGTGRTPAILGWFARHRWGRAIVFALAPSAGVITVAGHSGSASPWLTGDGRPAGAVHTSRRPRSDAPTGVALLYGAGDQRPFAVAKFAHHPSGVERLMHERAALSDIAASAASCGCDVPTLVAHSDDHIVMSAVAGTSARQKLQDEPEELLSTLRPTFETLGDWQRHTMSMVTVDDQLLASTILDALGIVVAACPDLTEYAETVVASALSTVGMQVPVVSRHGDATAANLFVAGDSIGFIDWESAGDASLPSTDEWYLLLDAISVVRSCSHADVLDLILHRPVGPIGDLVRLVDDTGASLGATATVRDLSFHATWIWHASHEIERGSTGGRFVQVLRRLRDGGAGGQMVSVTALASDDGGDDRPTIEAHRT